MSHRSQVAKGIVEYFSHHARPDSTFTPMYRQILGTVAEKAETLDWFLDASAQRTPLETSLLLTAGMHRQVLLGVEEAQALRDYYPSVGGTKSPDDQDFERLYLEAMDDCKEKLIPIIQHETVQTNETQRGLFWLFPASITQWKRIHLLDLGASAGLNLVADQRRFTWSDGKTSLSFGAAGQEQFVSQVKPRIPKLWTSHLSVPSIVSRNGCDLHPFPIKSEADRAKLESFVWPDQVHRFTRLLEGIEAYKKISEAQPISIQQASLPHELPKLLNSFEFEDEFPVIIYNTYMTTYLEDEGRALRGYIDEWAASQNRNVMWVQSEPTEATPMQCAWTVDLWEGEETRHWELACTHPHGTEIDFLEDIDDFVNYFQP